MSVALLASLALASGISQQDNASPPTQAYVVRPVDVEVRPIHEVLNCCGDLDAVEAAPEPHGYWLDGRFEVVRIFAGTRRPGEFITESFQASRSSHGAIEMAFMARRGRSALMAEIDDDVVCLMPDDIEAFDLRSAFAEATTDEEGMRCIPALEP